MKGPRLGLELGSAAARTESLHMGTELNGALRLIILMCSEVT